VSTYGCKKKSKFLRKKNNKSAILPFFTVSAVASQPAQAQSAPPKPMPTAPMPKVEEAPAPPKKTTLITSENKSKLSKLLQGRNAGAGNDGLNDPNNLRNNSFTADQLGASWITFSKRIPQLPDIHYIFSKEPEINGTEITITVTSSIVEHKLQENMELLKQHLCNDVKNDYINVVINLDKSAANNLSLTAKEKARLMNEKNPHLMTMFKEWKLKLY
jgi:hypothetical protein